MSKSDIERLFDAIKEGDKLKRSTRKETSVIKKGINSEGDFFFKRNCDCRLQNCSFYTTDYAGEMINELNLWTINGKPLTLGPPPKRVSGFGKWVRDNAL